MSDNKYLSVHINEYFKDDNGIKCQIKAMYAGGNTMIRKFHICSKEVKSKLFKFFCTNMLSYEVITNMYCAQSRSNYKVTSYKQMVVMYNYIFMYLHFVKGICLLFQSYEMKSILSLNDTAISIQRYNTFFTMCIYTTLCDLLISYFNQ